MPFDGVRGGSDTPPGVTYIVGSVVVEEEEEEEVVVVVEEVVVEEEEGSRTAARPGARGPVLTPVVAGPVALVPKVA